MSFEAAARHSPRVPELAGCYLDLHVGTRVLMESILELAARTKNLGWNGARRCKRGPELGAIWCLLADPHVAGSMVGGGVGDPLWKGLFKPLQDRSG